MKRILILIFLGFIFSQSYGCKLNWDTTCKKNEDCCSNHCYEESHWQFGVCKPGKWGEIITLLSAQEVNNINIEEMFESALGQKTKKFL